VKIAGKRKARTPEEFHSLGAQLDLEAKTLDPRRMLARDGIETSHRRISSSVPLKTAQTNSSSTAPVKSRELTHPFSLAE
jgi:hypothetical protein